MEDFCSDTPKNTHLFSSSSSSFSSSSVAAIRKTPHCVSLKKASLTRRGYKSFEDWSANPNHLYIGRTMSHHVAGAQGSKWGNPFKVNKSEKNSRKKCLKRYEDHIRNDPDLFNAVMELEGKELGCWCKPSLCHGDILIKLFKERQCTNSNPCFSNSDSVTTKSQSSPINDLSVEYQTTILSKESDGKCPVNVKCTSRDQEITEEGNGSFENNYAVFAPLRLTGGGDTSFECQENINSEYQGSGIFENSITNSDSPCEALSSVNQDNSMSEQDIRDVLYEAGYTIEAIENIITSKAGNLNKSLNLSETKESDDGCITGKNCIRVRFEDVVTQWDCCK